jgi:hypothetical protein
MTNFTPESSTISTIVMILPLFLNMIAKKGGLLLKRIIPIVIFIIYAAWMAWDVFFNNGKETIDLIEWSVALFAITPLFRYIFAKFSAYKANKDAKQ